MTFHFSKNYFIDQQVLFSMGQNHTKDQWLQYSSKDFFQQQIEFYKWRSNPQYNTHICRVNFQLQQSIQDRQKLQLLLQTRFQTGEYVSLSDILRLAGNRTNKSKEELMNFQSYVCTLFDFQERLTLPQTLHCLQILFSGYEVLYAKMGKLKVKLIYVFITKEGEIRCWINKDYKSNSIVEDPSQMEPNSPFLSSQMAIIKKIIELGEKLVTNHTEYLHFTRQFKSCMERDILHNWNFSNARKLINSYAYTYKLNLPNNLKQCLNRLIQTSTFTTVSLASYTQVQSSNVSLKQSKNDFVSTGDVFMRKQQFASNPSSSRKQNQARPVSLSDYSSKKSEQNFQPFYKMHAKKFSSIDLKNINDRSKNYQSPKLSRSQLLSNNSHSEFRGKGKQYVFQHTVVQQASNKMRRQRQFACVGQSPQTKLNSTQLSPYTHSYSITQHETVDMNTLKLDESKIKNKQNVNQSILKQNQNTKQKKKLQKKAAAVSKYISFYQQTKQLSNNNISNSSVTQNHSDFAEQPICVQRMNVSPSPSYSNLSQKLNINEEQIIKSQLSQPKLDLLKKPNSNVVSPMNKVTFQNFQNNASMVMPFRGKTQHFKTWQNNESNVGSHNSSQHRMCYTIKTLNKLVNNSDVSLHESNGSFSSIHQSQGSQYKGILAKMGRSVDIINLPSNKNVTTLNKRPTTDSHLNRSINS